MSTINSKNVQVGTSGVANQNFTLYQPATPDGTVRLGVGNSGATTSDVVTVTNAGNMTVSGAVAGGNLSYTGTLTGSTGVVNIGSGQVYKDASGNVGIGTSSPGYKLTVNGRISYSGAIGEGADTTLSSAGTTVILGESATWTALSFRTGSTERARIDSTGNFSITQAPGKYTVDTSGGATSIANGGTVDFPNASGMLVVNNWLNGAVTIYLCGGGSTATIGSVIGTTGSFAYNSGVNGYRWTNNYGSTGTFGFFFVRTRSNA
jgi:hypothetical protein